MSKLPDVSRPLIIKRVPVSQVVPWDKNPRGIKTADFERLKKQILTLGVYKPLVAYKDGEQYVVLGGNMRIRALKSLGVTEVDVSLVKPKTEADKVKIALSDNDRAGFYEEERLAELVLPHLEDINVSDFKVDIGEPLDLRSLLERFAPNLDGSEDQVTASLAERFIIPPLSVFDTRQGYWQDRKKAWTSLGIESYESREGTKATGSLSGTVPRYYSMKKKAEKRLGRELTREEFAKKYLPDLLPEDSMLHCTEGGGILSVFDPVLCEIVYRWFCPRGGSVLDPFSGGSVRGIVASSLGLRYTGVDIRKAQVEANRRQAEKILLPETRGHDFAGDSSRLITDPEELTPVDKIGDIWAKREDLFAFAGARGGKVRACLKIASTPRWIVGNSLQIDKKAPGEYDFVFSCPPYFDLERYSDDVEDLSSLNWEEFCRQYGEIVRKSCGMLKENRFACFVVGDIRDKTGLYRNFIGETVNAFRAAGLSLYNEIILVNVVGTAPIRVGKPFGQYRKVGKVHQNVLVFYKGKNPKDIKRDFPADVVEGVDP